MKMVREVVVLDVKSQREWCIAGHYMSGCQPHGIWDKAVHFVLVIMMPWIMGRLSIKYEDCHPKAACFHLLAFLLRSNQRLATLLSSAVLHTISTASSRPESASAVDKAERI
jgi:hypothetical protein